LPPSLGHFPLCKVDDYLDKVPEEWKKTGGIFFPLQQREAMWMGFSCPYERPKALKIGVGKVNAINGKPWSDSLEEGSYITLPKQPWIDGINAGGEGTIKQFVAMPLGSGYSVEAQVTGEEKFGGIQIIVFDPFESKRKEKFPDIVPGNRLFRVSSPHSLATANASPLNLGMAAPMAPICSKERKSSAFTMCDSVSYNFEQPKEMSLSAGGSMKQQIFKDDYGIDFWDQSCFGRCYIRIVNSTMFKQITGKDAPPTPISAQTYSQHGYPWFDIYNEDPANSIQQSSILNNVKSVKEIDAQKYAWPQQDDSTIKLSASQVKTLCKPSNDVRDGDW
jgi:hypothetical protein